MNRVRTTEPFLVAGAIMFGLASCDLMLVTSVESRALDASVSHASGVPGVRVTLAGNAGVFHTTTDHSGNRYLDRVPLNPADAFGISFLLTWDELVRDRTTRSNACISRH